MVNSQRHLNHLLAFHILLSSFALASKTRIVLQYSHLCTHSFFFFLRNQNANVTFAVNAILMSPQTVLLRTTLTRMIIIYVLTT